MNYGLFLPSSKPATTSGVLVSIPFDLILLRLSSPVKGPCDHIEPAQIIQDNLRTLKVS